MENAEEICEESEGQDTTTCSPLPEEGSNRLWSCQQLDGKKKKVWYVQYNTSTLHTPWQCIFSCLDVYFTSNPISRIFISSEQIWQDVMQTEEQEQEETGPENQVLVMFVYQTKTDLKMDIFPNLPKTFSLLPLLVSCLAYCMFQVLVLRSSPLRLLCPPQNSGGERPFDDWTLLKCSHTKGVSCLGTAVQCIRHSRSSGAGGDERKRSYGRRAGTRQRGHRGTDCFSSVITARN